MGQTRPPMPLNRYLSLIGKFTVAGICSSPSAMILCGGRPPLQLLPMPMPPTPPCGSVERHAGASLQLAMRRSVDLLKVKANSYNASHAAHLSSQKMVIKGFGCIFFLFFFQKSDAVPFQSLKTLFKMQGHNWVLNPCSSALEELAGNAGV